MKFIIFLALVLNGFVFSYGQTCDCKSNFEWVKKTFEENDAGFHFVLDAKGKKAYDEHNQAFAQKVSNIADPLECTKMLYEWLTFFRPSHIGIIPIQNEQTAKTEAPASQAAPEKWETLKVNVPEFERYLNNKKSTDYEGVWETSPYKIGVKKVDNAYIGFIIETTAEDWKPGQIKFKIQGNKGVFYLRDRTPENFAVVQPIGQSYLRLGRFMLKRLIPQAETIPGVEAHFKSLNADKPYADRLNSTTYILRIPSFDGVEKKAIDSVILANKSDMLKTENLIIDVRNNGGGSDGSYKEIIPFLYTNPIRELGVEYYSTHFNNQRMMEFLKNPDKYGLTEEDKKWAKTSYDVLERHIGEFINLDSVKVNLNKLDTVYPFPKNVAIIINKGNGSTTEQFLLAAKQSKKVKLFGATTFGVLDISNMNFVNSPCNEFELGYCLSKSYRIPEMAIDGKGIQPDYYIDSEIPDYQWIEYVNGVLNQK